jgi:hypothetical protein
MEFVLAVLLDLFFKQPKEDMKMNLLSGRSELMLVGALQGENFAGA